jgi:CheY-like chemotaxis protein
MPRTPSPNGHGPHILAINNDQTMLALFRDLLEEEGYRVTTQAYLDHDLDDIRALEPDAIVLDYMWASDDNAWSLLNLLRLSPDTAAIPIVLCTGAVREVEALSAHFEELGIRVVFKPFNIDQLIDVLGEALAAAKVTKLTIEQGIDRG